MEWIAVALALVFSLLGLGCLLLTLLGLPGNWVMIALAAGVVALQGSLGIGGPHQSPLWWSIALAAGLAVAGEIVETAAGAAGTHAGGGSGRGMVGAILGGLVGGIALTPVIPIPVVGTLVGALLGTFGGALVAEMTGTQRVGGAQSIRAAAGATAGRLMGSMAKTVVGAAVWVLLTFELLFH